MFCKNKLGKVGNLGKAMKSMFNKVENNIWKRWCL